MTNSKRGVLVVVTGPTGSGKTDISVELARRLGAPIISADSRQVFRGMPIGTAQPSADQLEAVKHYFINDRDVTDDYTSGEFEKEALALLKKLFADNKYVLAVGGSGLYVDALCYGFDPLPLADRQLRAELEERLKADGVEALAAQLKELDPVYYDEVDRNNPARVMRALEVCIASGKPYSSQRSGRRSTRDFDIIKIGVDVPRAELYDRIDRRVDMMVDAGLEDEARTMYQFRDMNALQTVGYKEFFDYFDGKTTREEAIDLVKRNSRRYAKRQMTWFRRDADMKWFGKNEIDSIENYIKKFAE